VAANRLAWEGYAARALDGVAPVQRELTVIFDYTGLSKGSPLADLQRLLRVGPAQVIRQPDPNRTVDFRVEIGTEYRACVYGSAEDSLATVDAGLAGIPPEVRDAADCWLRFSAEVNVRQGPGLDYPPVDVATPNDFFPVTGRTADRTWWQVSADGVPAWVLKLLVKYPTAANLARAKVRSISQIPFVSTTKAEALVLNAKKSVASAVDEVTQQLVAATVKQILHLKETIKIQTAIMAKACAVPEVDLLKTFIGISDASAIGLILNIQSVKRFKTVKKLAAFFGIHPKLKISGDGVSAVRMSKEGRAEPRQILYMVAMVAITHNPLIREIYEKHVSQGMEKMAAIGLCMHKILRIAYGMLKNNRPFDPEIDRRNSQKPTTHRKQRENKTRRYQDYDSKAPISRRQKAKRMEQRQSQSDNGATVRDLSPRSIPDVSLP
jgi:SH3-like domain-containing protein